MIPEITLAVLVAIVIGLVQAAKMAGLSSRYAPFVSIMFGFAIAFLLVEESVRQQVTIGLIIGLTASGLYSGVKASASN